MHRCRLWLHPRRARNGWATARLWPLRTGVRFTCRTQQINVCSHHETLAFDMMSPPVGTRCTNTPHFIAATTLHFYDSGSEPEEDTIEANPQDTNEPATTATATAPLTAYYKMMIQQMSSCNHWLTTWCGLPTKPDDLLAANGVASWIFTQSRACWNQVRMIVKHHDDIWTRLMSKCSPAIATKQKRCRKRGRPAKRWEDDTNS